VAVISVLMPYIRTLHVGASPPRLITCKFANARTRSGEAEVLEEVHVAYQPLSAEKDINIINLQRFLRELAVKCRRRTIAIW